MRPRIYTDPAEKHRAYRQRRREELQQLRTAPDRVARHPRHALDVYLTPPAFVRAGVGLVTITPSLVLDCCAGDGRWGQAARARWPAANIAGVELRDVEQPAGFDHWFPREDFLALDFAGIGFDLVIGNPPYGIAEQAIRRGLSLLNPGGELVFLLRLAFREGQQRGRGLFREFPPAEIAVCDKRPTFYGDGRQTGMTAHAYFRWSKDHTGPTLCTTAMIDEETE